MKQNKIKKPTATETLVKDVQLVIAKYYKDLIAERCAQKRVATN